MRYIETYDNFKPIVNKLLDKPYKVKKNIDKSIQFLQRRIKSLRKRLDDDNQTDDRRTRSDMNKDKNEKIQKLKHLTFKQTQQNAYLRANPVKEGIESEMQEPKNLVDVLESDDFKPEDIEKYIGLKEKNYIIQTEWNYKEHKYVPIYDDISLTIYTKESILEELMNIEQGVIGYFFGIINPYSNWEYYVDDGELNYIGRNLTDENIEKVKKLGEMFDIKLKFDEYGVKEGEIYNLFEELGLKKEIQELKYDIESEYEDTIKIEAKKIIKELPFEISSCYKDDFNLEITFSYESIIEYIKKNNLKDIKTIKDFLKNVSSDLSYEIDSSAYENLGDFEDLNRNFEYCVENYIDSPDDVFPRLIIIDNLDLFKKKIDLARFDYVYDAQKINWNLKNRMNLFQLAKHYNNSICSWFNSEKFDIFIKTRSEDELASYREFKYGEDTAKFNL